MKLFLLYSSLILSFGLHAQGPFAPAANQTGTTAMHKDSSAFAAWATKVEINRGLQDIAIANSDTVSVGNAQSCFGIADANVLSLGDHGSVIVQFDGLIYNGTGPDFAIFENSFNTTFLELAFVEVSSDGVNYFRFPSYSLTDTATSVGSFGSVQAYNVHNLAGKYHASYGTPFDLEDLKNIQGLDVQSVSHIRIVDVVGSMDVLYAQRDSEGRKINDQYPTPFPSGGFDLDAVGVIYLKAIGLNELSLKKVKIHPNPSNGNIKIDPIWLGADFRITSSQGSVITEGILESDHLHLAPLKPGIYVLKLSNNRSVGSTKIIIR